MRILSIEHEEDSGASLLAGRAVERGFIVDVVVPPERTGIPGSVVGYDAVMVMGATPSVNDPRIASWLCDELVLLRDAYERSIPVLGVCFGAQALAVALGGSVRLAPRPEYGWHMVDTDDPSLIPPGPWAQWHVDAIDPPPGATVVARSDVCVQAYVIGPHLAVQFHPEVTPEQLNEWARTDETADVDRAALRDRSESLRTDSVRRAHALFDRWVSAAHQR